MCSGLGVWWTVGPPKGSRRRSRRTPGKRKPPKTIKSIDRQFKEKKVTLKVREVIFSLLSLSSGFCGSAFWRRGADVVRARAQTRSPGSDRRSRRTRPARSPFQWRIYSTTKRKNQRKTFIKKTKPLVSFHFIVNELSYFISSFIQY